MSLATKLAKLVEYQNSLRQALIDKGANVAEDATIADFASAVENIPAGSGGISEDDLAVLLIEEGLGLVSTTGLSRATKIATMAFLNNYQVTSVESPLCISIGSSAFYGCAYLTQITFPNCSYIGAYAFYSCSVLEIASFPLCSVVGSSAFYYCYNIRTVSLPECNTLYTYAFGGPMYGYKGNITSMYIPKCVSIFNNVMYNQASMQMFSAPMAKYIGSYAFYGCEMLSTVYLPNIATVGSGTFNACSRLSSLYMTGSSVAVLQGNPFFTTAYSSTSTFVALDNAKIYVRLSLLENWQKSTNWVSYSSHFAGLTDEEIAALDAEGE